jgi:hypothetical protein
MTLHGALTILDARIAPLAQAFDNVLWAAVQGQPTGGYGHVLVDQYDALANDAMVLVGAAQGAATEAIKGATGPFDAESVGNALARCHDRIHHLTHLFYTDLLATERIDALTKLARARRGEWATWVQGIKDALGPCPQLLFETGLAIIACWQDFAERTGALTTVVAPSRMSESRALSTRVDE